jgi:threonine synthase
MAFKDVGARFMSRCFSYFNKDIKKDSKTRFLSRHLGTGGAVASGFSV